MGFRFTPGEDFVTVQQAASVAWPAKLVVEPGTKLVFINLDPNAHTLTSDGCPDGQGYEEPSAPPPVDAVASAFDDTVAPTLFGQPPVPEPTGPCWFDSRGSNPNGFTNQGAQVEIDTSRLPVGDYKFHCVIHDFMQGTLHVVT